MFAVLHILKPSRGGRVLKCRHLSSPFYSLTSHNHLNSASPEIVSRRFKNIISQEFCLSLRWETVNYKRCWQSLKSRRTDKPYNLPSTLVMRLPSQLSIFSHFFGELVTNFFIVRCLNKVLFPFFHQN